MENTQDKPKHSDKGHGMAKNELHPTWGGRREGQGRPKGWRKTDGTERTTQLQIRLTAVQKEELKERAQAANLTVSAYVLKTLFS